MLTRIGERARRWAQTSDPWTNVYGVARTLVALASAITMACNHSDYLFAPLAGMERTPACVGVAKAGLFCLTPEPLFEPARWLAVAALLLVASGYRPRWTALLHWYVAFSISNNVSILDGGDAVALCLTTLLAPIALTDSRKWHWSPARPRVLTRGEEARRIVALWFLLLLRLQVAGIYFHAAIGKFGVEEWVDGTAMWYFTNNPLFGMNASLLAVIMPALKSPVVLPLLTWSVLVFEYVLSAGLFMDRRYRRPLLVLGILFHGAIIVMFGLVSFATAMFGALVVFLRPFDEPFALERFGRVSATLRSAATAMRQRAAAAATGVGR